MVTYMLQKKNLSDIIRLLSGFLLSLKLLFNSFGVNFITYNQIDAIVNMDRTKKGLKKEPFIQVPFYHCRTTTSFVCSGPYDTPLY